MTEMGVIKQGTGLAASTFKNTSSEDVFSICPWPCFHIQSLASFYPQPAPPRAHTDPALTHVLSTLTYICYHTCVYIHVF